MRRVTLFRLVAALFLLSTALLTPRSQAASAVLLDPVLAQQLASVAPTERVSAIATFAAQPADSDLRAMLSAGVAIAPLTELPMVGVVGTPAQITALQLLPGLRSLYANQRLEYFLRESVKLIGATKVWETYGFKGDGVGVAVLDTGVDATHPDLEYGSQTVENVKIVGLQYAAGSDLNQFDLPVQYVPRVANTDTTSGHGTHVAGIVGASGAASSGYYQGVAPEADLIGLGAGDVIEIFTALAGFDWVLQHRDDYNIRVVNCSWGNIIPGFDPNNPVNVASKAVHDAGVTVVFSSGNSGSTTDTLNTYSVAPWVIGVAAGDKDGKSVSFFSSRGIPGDNFYHPTITAPGFLIVSNRTVTGAAVNGSSTATDAAFVKPEYLPYYTTANGTSMAAPHVSGAIALMLEANPKLTPDVIKFLLTYTATPMPGFQEYAAGAGYLNVKAAVDQALQIKNLRWVKSLKTGKWEWVYDQTSTWTGTVGASVPGLAASDTHSVTVAPGTVSLEVAVDWSTFANDLSLYLYDPQGRLVAKSEVIQSVYNYANETVHVDEPVAGTWTVKVSGLINAPQDYRATSNAVVRFKP